jgi:hypothetical protein
VEIESQEPAEREVALTHPVVRPVDLAVEREDQTDAVLGDRVGRVARHPHHRHASTVGCVEIHVVEPGGSKGDEPNPHPGEAGEHLGSDIVVHERAHRVASGGQGHRRRGQPRLEVDQVVTVVVVRQPEELLVVGLRAVHRDSHGDIVSARRWWAQRTVVR